MTKIDKILNNFDAPCRFADKDYGDWSPSNWNQFTNKDMIEFAKEYAEFYAQRCLEIAAKEASANFECIGAVLGAENVNPYVEQESILKIKLPSHD